MLGEKKIERQIEAKSFNGGGEAAGDPDKDRGHLKDEGSKEGPEQVPTQGQAVVGLMGRGSLYHLSRRWREPLNAWLRMLRFYL